MELRGQEDLSVHSQARILLRDHSALFTFTHQILKIKGRFTRAGSGRVTQNWVRVPEAIVGYPTTRDTRPSPKVY